MWWEERALELSSLLEVADAIWKAHPTVTIRKAGDNLATELDLLSSAQAEKPLRWTKYKFYSSANKPGPVLARKLNLVGGSYKPVRLRVRGGGFTLVPSRIVSSLVSFLSSLYSRPASLDLDKA